jgi:FkbM family methyltransferase
MWERGSVGFKARMKSRAREWADRAGYSVLPKWRMGKLDQSTHIKRLLDRLRIDCVLDVGANIGQYQEFLRLHVGYTGRILSFEPVRELYDRLIASSRGDPKWAVYPYALGERDSRAEINVLREQTLTSFLSRDEPALRSMGYEKYLNETELDRTETVDVRRLDAVFDTIVPRGARVFLKSDTQGYDMNVVRGASGCLDRVLGLQIELAIRQIYRGAPKYLDAIEELNALGYEATGLYPVQRDSSLRIVNIDCVMIREEEATRLRGETAAYGN